MEWRQQTSVSCADAFNEAQRWIEKVTGKTFGCSDFRAALENGVLLCDLINQLKPGIIKRVNRLSTPIAGLDNVSVFLKACGKLGLNESQLFHPGDLQDLSSRVTLRRDESSRRLKNVLITVYWLGRKANQDPFYNGPQLNLKAFEGLLGLALSKALDDASNCYLEKEEIHRKRPSYKRQSSVDSNESVDAKAITTNTEGCGSDAEAEQVFKMETTHASNPRNKGYLPPPLQKAKQARGEQGKGCTTPLSRACQIQITPERPVQVNPGWIWSKSLSDIPMVYPVRKIPDGNTILNENQETGTTRQEFKRKSSATKDTEAQWHDDLTKWKNRRRSSKSDLRRKSQDREHVINQMTNGSTTNFEKSTTQSGLMKRDQQSPHTHNQTSHPYSTSTTAKSTRSNLRPHTRALLARSYATETPFNSPTSYKPQTSPHLQGSLVGAMPASDGNILGKESHIGSLASFGAAATAPSVENPFSSQTQVKNSPAPILPVCQNQTDSFTGHASILGSSVLPNETTKLNAHAADDLILVSHTVVDTHDDFSNNKSQGESQKSTGKAHMEPDKGHGPGKYLLRAGTWSGSASLPRGYRRSEGSSRLSSVISARPFGTKPSRVSSLPRLCNVDDSQQNLLSNNEKEESFSPPISSLLKRQTATAHLKGHPPVRQALNQTEHSSAEQEEGKCSTLSRHNTVQTNGFQDQPYVQTQLQTHNDRSTRLLKEPSGAMNVDHSDMRVCLTLKPNSRQDFGFQTHWDTKGARVKSIQPGSPAELCQLCVNDEIIAVDGAAVSQMNYSQWKNKMTSAMQTGSLTMDVRRYGNTDWSTSEASHYKQPGQNMMTLDLTTTVPVLIGRPDHHANSAASADTTLMTMSKINGQTNNVNLSKGMDGEHTGIPRTARSKGGSESAISDLQVPSLSPSSSCWSWDKEDERRRQEKWQEEQERLLQEKYQRDQERLEAEWRRAQQDVSSDMAKKEELKDATEMVRSNKSQLSLQLHVNGVTHKTQTDESPTTKEMKDEGNSLSEAKEMQHDKTSEDWADGSCGFAQLSPAHRAKSLSTPILTSPQKQMSKNGAGDQRKRKSQPVSKVEQERQQILEEMKKRTQLLTDNSWIRQRSSSFYKEPIMPGVPIKRYESMDNLDSWRQSPVAALTFTYPRPHSAAAGFCGSSRPTSSRYSTGSILPPRSTAGSAWAVTNISEEQKQESKSGSETRGRTVSHAISSSSPLVPPPCHHNTALHIME